MAWTSLLNERIGCQCNLVVHPLLGSQGHNFVVVSSHNFIVFFPLVHLCLKFHLLAYAILICNSLFWTLGFTIFSCLISGFRLSVLPCVCILSHLLALWTVCRHFCFVLHIRYWSGFCFAFFFSFLRSANHHGPWVSWDKCCHHEAEERKP